MLWCRHFLGYGNRLHCRHRLDNVIEDRRCSLYSLKRWILLAFVIVQIDGIDVGIGLNDQMDRFLAAFCMLERIAENIAGEDSSVDSNYSLAGREFCLIRR